MAKKISARPTAARKPGAPNPHPRPSAGPSADGVGASGVRVRMYRQGLGDCFLLTFPRPTGGPFHMLIDCGVILGTKNPQEIMGRVAKDIAATTDHHLHVLVATHEHWDHLSGFLQAQDVFDDMKIDEVWFAWTEDRSDDLAERLRQSHRRTLRALRAVGQKMASVKHPAVGRVEGMLEFFGAAKGKTTRDALDYLAQHKSAPRVRYCRPSEPPLSLDGVDGARIFVLGPPHDEKLIKRINPSKTGKEVYELAQDPDSAFFAAVWCLGAEADGEAELVELAQAFESRFRLAPATAEKMPFFQKSYGTPADKSQAWRRIDADWLGGAEQLALNLDSDTNNTSLALAIELGAGGGVLLFPGDAQVGNWESWQNCSWPAAGGSAAVTANDLLRRTVLYKVGHHASHNATMRAHGLELMESPDLTALIPVDHAMAVKKNWVGMPFPSLLERLQEKAQGRVIRIDDGVPDKPGHVSDVLWKEFTRRVREDPDKLYIDYTVNG